MGFALRLVRLGAESLWYDETVSAFLARKSVPALVAHTARDIHPPAYYLLLHGWQQIVHPTLAHGLEFLYAWPSLFWGVLLLPLLYALGRFLFDRRLALLALWIGALHPFHVWYSQEVRMYTMGAALGLICLWATLKWQAEGNRQPPSIAHGSLLFTHNPLPFVYVVAAALGLYTLYYFAFLLIALNVMVFAFYILRNEWVPFGRATLPSWLLAQGVVLLLWSPWVPVFWRQVAEPPVPPWRTGVDLLMVLRESLAALVVGQSPPLQAEWLWAGMALVVIGAALFGAARRAWQPQGWKPAVGAGSALKRTLSRTGGIPARIHEREHAAGDNVPVERSADRSKRARTVESGGPVRRRMNPAVGVGGVLLYTFVPLLIIAGLSLTVTPLYHVRYFFTYAAAAPLLLAAGLDGLALGRRWLLPVGLVALFAVNGWSLAKFWTAPLYRADDHRGAVADLAAAWRPGDAILINAGWAYPVLELYWPDAVATPTGAIPPMPAARSRIHDYTNGTLNADASRPIVLITGSVDGDLSLGWGLPDSDFFAISAAETVAALEAIRTEHARLWHYRLYDTVSDPQGVIRAWLAEQGDRVVDQPYPGRDFLRVQGFDLQSERFCPADVSNDTRFGEILSLVENEAAESIQAGTFLYATFCWRALAALPDLRTSLRLYRMEGEDAVLVAQQDGAPLVPTTTWSPGTVHRQALALPVPAALPPGSYSLQLIVYDAATGAPLPVDDPDAVFGQRLPLAEVAVALPHTPPPTAQPLAVFDYIELVQASSAPAASPGGTVDVTLVWRPRFNQYKDTYNATFSVDGPIRVNGAIEPLGPPAYPSGAWEAAYPVLEQVTLPLPADLPAGLYTLSVGLQRASDGLAIPARTGLLPWQRADTVPIATVEIRP